MFSQEKRASPGMTRTGLRELLGIARRLSGSIINGKILIRSAL
jgi:hypothetical protein